MCLHEMAAVEEGMRIDKLSEDEERKRAANVDFVEPDEDDDVVEDNLGLPEKSGMSSYVAKLPRRIMPCESDYVATAELLFGVAGSKVAHANRDNLDNENSADDDDKLFVVYDTERECVSCGLVLSCTKEGRNCSIRNRRMRIHTLLHGTVGAVVADLVCRECQCPTLFDGRMVLYFVGHQQSFTHASYLTFGYIKLPC